uniref:RNA-dependent RNA polymerase n=1 Tax=Poccolus virus TaxID=2800941 RepID=A0A894KKI1_9VIRU|nr:MAG: RNA-dependent RNA polymerase [Poccolus virus]
MPRGFTSDNREFLRADLSRSKKDSPRDNSASGSRVKRCCSLVERRTKETISNGLRIIRARFGIPMSELPNLSVTCLDKYLLLLLRRSPGGDCCPFPRHQTRRDESGLCNLQRLTKRHRWEFAHSVSSIKRNLPAGCRFHLPSPRREWESRAFSQPPPTSSAYLDFVRQECRRIFTSNWDRDYDSFVGNHVPNPTNRKCHRRADNIWQGRRGEFLTRCLYESEVIRFSARYKEVTSAGKLRPLLIFDENIDLLAPLHKCMYSHLMRKRWLLCGSPTEKRMSSTCSYRYQTSVDLVNATDGLSHDVVLAILGAAWDSSSRVPNSTWLTAANSLCPSVRRMDGSTGYVSHGQMMGAYLSFPLLCIQSYVAARWAARDVRSRILINGDDCVISADRPILAEDYPKGFQLNGKKTIRAEGIVEINSTCFLRGKKGWRMVRHLRRGGATSTYAGLLHIAAACVEGKWASAFVRSRVGSRWRLSPRQLDLPLTYPTFQREQSIRKTRTFSALPSLTSMTDDRLQPLGRRADPCEEEAVRSLLWSEGRCGGCKRDTLDLSQGQVYRTFHFRTAKGRGLISRASRFIGTQESYVCARLAGVVRRRNKKEREVGFSPWGFINQKESEGLHELEELARVFSAGHEVTC